MNKKLGEIIASKYFSFFVTVILFAVLYGAGIAMYKGFMKPQVFFNLFIDNAALIIVTVGITFTLLIGGIDLSVGAVLALTCMVLAWILANTGIPVFAAIFIVLLMGTLFGALQGYIIAKFDLQPFIITLAGMLFCRGMTAVISRETINITDPVFVAMADFRLPVGPGFVSMGVLIALAALIVAAVGLYQIWAQYLRPGRQRVLGFPDGIACVPHQGKRLYHQRFLFLPGRYCLCPDDADRL